MINANVQTNPNSSLLAQLIQAANNISKHKIISCLKLQKKDDLFTKLHILEPILARKFSQSKARRDLQFCCKVTENIKKKACRCGFDMEFYTDSKLIETALMS